MRDYIDVTGKNEEEAIRKGLEQLGLDRDDVSIEILERAKAGFLGFGSAPAKIRMSYGPERQEPQAEPEVVKPAETSAEPVKRRPPKKTPAAAPTVPAPSTDAENRPAGNRPGKGRERRKPEAQKDTQAVPRPKDAPKPKDAPHTPSVQKDAPRPDEEVNDEKAAAIRAFLSGLLEHMECKATVRVYQAEEGRYKVILEGNGIGALIGRRGETLDAIQQLTNYAVNRNGVRVRIQLDAEGYREKREQTLRNLARKEASKVVKYRRSRTLEPMNAYERHVIHTALQDFSGVNTYSTGVDPNRRVVIAFDRESVSD